jgi:hypothetical protein
MTFERRAEYFNAGGRYMLSDDIDVLVQQAFLYEMQQIDLSNKSIFPNMTSK